MLIFVRKDEVEYLKKKGLEGYIIGKTCHGTKFVEEHWKVLRALEAYNAKRNSGRRMEG